ncbi:hypothetical protein [Lapidilactobacillus bayanensis]|uniref:hypothetical protein n=1 Tax=Lapidilactobacillus bayanensis TaxID=2485998 RepID=UPI000F784DD7|nr:hypothetical protein [Lapidilactobacillus bayanensis]
MKKLAVIVFLGTLPITRGEMFIIPGRGKKFTKKLNTQLEEFNMDWTVKIDPGTGNIDEIKKEHPSAIILINGLQDRFYADDFPKQNIYQMGPTELTEQDTSGVIRFLKKLG